MAYTNLLLEPIVIDFPNYRKQTFKTIEQILDFGQSELDAWEAFQTKTNVSRPVNSTNPADLLVNSAREVCKRAQQYIDSRAADRQNSIYPRLNLALNAYAKDDQLVMAASASGKIVLSLVDKNPAAASVLLSSIVGQTIPFNHVVDALAFSQAVHHAEQAWEKPESYAAAHKSMMREINNEWEELAESVQLNIQARVIRAEQATNTATKQAKARDRHFRNAFKAIRNKYDAAVENLTNLEITYHKKLQLEAPAAYWEERKKNHLLASRIAAGVFLIGIGLTLWYVITHGTDLIGILPKDKAGNIGLGAIAILTIPAAGVAWALRVFTRLFSHHMSMAADAAQRQTMVTTYLALANDPNANLGPDERILILNALFRPSENHGKADAPPPNLLEIAKAVKAK